MKIYKKNDNQVYFIEMNFNEILDVTSMKEHIYPFNINIKGKNDNQIIKDKNLINECRGPGVYFITEKKNNYLLYIGVHSPDNDTVYEARYFKHISSFTLRGHSVHKQTKNNIIYNLIKNQQYGEVLQKYLFRECKGKNILNESLVNCLIDSMIKRRKIYKRSVGLQLSLRRVAYANFNWGLFESEDLNIIKSNLQNHFLFYYIKLPKFLQIPVKNRERFLAMRKKIESKLIYTFKPLINDDSPNIFDFKEENFENFSISKTLKKINELY